MSKEDALRTIALEEQCELLKVRLQRLEDQHARELERTEAIHSERLQRDKALHAIELERNLELLKISHERAMEGLRAKMADEIRRRIQAEKALQSQRELETEVQLLLGFDRQKARDYYQERAHKLRAEIQDVDQKLAASHHNEMLLQLEEPPSEQVKRQVRAVVLERLPVERSVFEQQKALLTTALERFERCLDQIF